MGKEGKYVMFCNILECLNDELVYNVVLCVEEMVDLDKFCVLGCGEFYLGIFIENMCCEGYEFVVLCLEVILKEENGEM